MKTSKTVGVYRLILSIVLIAMVVAVVGIAVDGWQQNQPNDSGTGIPDTPSAGNPNDSIPPPPTVDVSKPVLPAYVSYLTGLETTEAQAKRNPLAIVMNATGTGYGLSSAAIAIELPLENGQTKFLAYMENTDTLGQVGTIAASRTYISDMLRSFGGLLVCYGNEDRIHYDGFDASTLTLDLKNKQGCSYTEGATDIYTNGYMIQNGLQSSMLQTDISESPAIPFTFTEFGMTVGTASMRASAVYLPYDEDNTTQLIYKESDKTYVLSKSGKTYTDHLSKTSVGFANVFVLFADATTYEKTDMTQMVMDTTTGGSGYYATEGGAVRITWRTDADGRMHFYDTAGRELTVNRGTSYISFFKSSLSSEVHFG